LLRGGDIRYARFPGVGMTAVAVIGKMAICCHSPLLLVSSKAVEYANLRARGTQQKIFPQVNHSSTIRCEPTEYGAT
jgi:hypothetical protein